MSSLRAILLHADATAGSAVRLEIARELAARHGASVTALFGATVDTDLLSSAYSAGAALGSRGGEWDTLAHDTARASLQEQCLGEGAEVAWFDVVGDSIAHGFIAEAAYADLLVIGQQSPDEPAGGAPEGFVESVILDSGKPTLVVPREPRVGSFGRRALVAWNGSAQAARAVTGALPLLRLSGQVHVAVWSRHPVAAPFSGIDIGVFLQGHGIEAVLHQCAPSSRVGQELAAMVQSLHADLVVMGCYGHSRTAERVLGGATRSMLATLPVPILMAH
jgi:nucleotide-binding universal stress UspA family protein